MLILNRILGETLTIGDDISVTVLGVNGNQVKLGINAPKNVEVHREEIYLKIKSGEKPPQKNAITSTENTGSISGLIANKGYGFIYSPGFDDTIFFHASSVTDNQFSDLFEGSDVTFKVEHNERGYIASVVRKI